jgi:hypothetical protein
MPCAAKCLRYWEACQHQMVFGGKVFVVVVYSRLNGKRIPFPSAPDAVSKIAQSGLAPWAYDPVEG